jgi:xanthine dehydrogenase accessory factor
MDRDVLRRLNAARAARQAAIVVTDLASGAGRLVLEAESAADPLAAQLGDGFRTGVSRLVESAGGPVFLTVSVPPPRLVVIGAVHISQALAPMARVAGLDMSVIDPRTAFATPERFPDVPLYAEWPDEALPRLGLDAYTGLAVLTHDPKIDDPALEAALAAGCFYVGALGSRKTHAARLERLRQRGIAASALERIHAPIGLAIGAQSPAEIAVAVLGEVIAALRSRGKDDLRATAA